MKFIVPILMSSLSFSYLSAAEGDTYMLSQPNMQEWQPPVKLVKVLPDRVVKKVAQTDYVYDPSQEVEDYIAPQVLFIFATVYMEGDRPYSHIRLQCENEKIEVWSSMNFMEMAGIHTYVARGIEYTARMDHGTELQTSASEAGCPVNRDKLNKDKARFLVVGERDDESSALEAMRGLHAIYNKEKVALKAAYLVRVANQEKARLWNEANPPEPEDVTIQFWKREVQTEEKSKKIIYLL